MEVSFGDFQPNELYNLIENKDPLGLNNDTEGQKTQQIEEFDAIPHYIKMASTLNVTNINNNAESNLGSEDKDREILTQASSQGPSQVNYPSTSKNICHTGKNNPYNMQLALHSSNNLSRKVSFKSFKNLQQSHKRSCTNSHNETSDVSDPESNNLTNSNELLDQFNTKTKEITKGLHELHFSTIDLRNKINSGRVNNGCPIITQVTGRNNIRTSTTTTTTSNQIRVDIYPQARLAGGR